MVQFRRFVEVLTVPQEGRFMVTLLDTKRVFHLLQRFPARTRVSYLHVKIVLFSVFLFAFNQGLSNTNRLL